MPSLRSGVKPLIPTGKDRMKRVANVAARTLNIRAIVSPSSPISMGKLSGSQMQMRSIEIQTACPWIWGLKDSLSPGYSMSWRLHLRRASSCPSPWGSAV